MGGATRLRVSLLINPLINMVGWRRILLATREISDEIRALEECLLTREARADREQLDSLMADDFFEFGSSGRVWDKAAVLRELPGEESFSFSVSDFQARQLGTDTVLATYRVRMESGGSSRSSLRSSVWASRDGRWQMLFHQGTRCSAAGLGEVCESSSPSGASALVLRCAGEKPQTPPGLAT